MALIVDDRIYETTNTTGTGPVVLNGAAEGYRAFANALQTGDETIYVLEDILNQQWEIGIGTFEASSNSLVRSTVLRSTNGNQLVNFAATSKNIYSTISGAGLPALLGSVLAVNPTRVAVLTASGLVGSGSGQSNGTALSQQINVVTSAPPGTAFVLPIPYAGLVVEVRNKDTVNTATIFPSSGAEIDTLGVNRSVSLPPSSMVIFAATSSTQWWS